MTFLRISLLALAFPFAVFAAQPPPVKPSPLWREWYLVTRSGKALGAYEEIAEARTADFQLSITQKWTEKTSKGKSEAYIGSVASEERLAPVAFFVERSGPKDYKVDGRVKNGKIVVTFKPQSGDIPKTTESTAVLPAMYLGSFVPLAIARHIREKGAFQFVAVVEDDGDMNVEVKPGTVEILGTQKKIGGADCHGALLRIDGALQEWWLTKEGKTCLVNYPDSDTRMELSTEKKAKKALEGP